MTRVFFLTLIVITLSAGCAFSEAPPTATSAPITPQATALPPTRTRLSAPTTTPTAQTGRPAITYIIDGDSGAVVGGVAAGRWLPVRLLAEPPTTAVYQSYVNSAPAGFVMVQDMMPAGPICPQLTAVSFADPVPRYSTLLTQPEWDATPRPVEPLAVDAEPYQTVVAQWLQENGIAEPDVVIVSALRVDLEGDGVDEVIINAARIASDLALPPAAAGDYSLVLLRQVAGDDVRQTAIAASVYPEAEELGYPWRYTATNILDLNGDGVLEIVISGTRYEGRASRIVAIQGGQPREVLSVTCPN